MLRLLPIIVFLFSLVSVADLSEIEEISVPNPDTGEMSTTHKISHVVGPVMPRTAFMFWLDFTRTRDLPGDRVILIDSPGGNVEDGDKIISIMEEEKRLGVRQICLVDGMAASMGFNILAHCDKRFATPKTLFLFHKIAFDRPGCLIGKRCTAKRLTEYARELKELDKNYDAYNRHRLRLGRRDYDFYADKDTRWSTEQLFKNGFIHGVVELNLSPPTPVTPE